MFQTLWKGYVSALRKKVEDPKAKAIIQQLEGKSSDLTEVLGSWDIMSGRHILAEIGKLFGSLAPMFPEKFRPLVEKMAADAAKYVNTIQDLAEVLTAEVAAMEKINGGKILIKRSFIPVKKN